MSHRATRSTEDLAEFDERDLYRTPPDTKRRVTKRPTERTPSDSDTEFESPLDRFSDQTPKPSKTVPMAEANEIRNLRDQLAQAEATIVNMSRPVDPEAQDEARRLEVELRRQQNEENERARQHELEMARLQLQIAQVNAAIPGPNPAAIQITTREDKVADFKKEVASKNLKLAFKLDGSSNYDAWRDEALTQALAIKAKHILTSKEMSCPETSTTTKRRKFGRSRTKHSSTCSSPA
jgi:small-conductance mechanosensitive channel